MRLPILITFLALLAGCSGYSQSNWNPLNWFGDQPEVTELVPAGAASAAEDPRPLVAEIVDVDIESTPGGAVISVVGLAPTQGFYGTGLVLDPDASSGSVVVYQLRAWPPPYQARVSTRQSRELIVGGFLSTQALQGVSQIRVVGANNTRSVRR